MTTTEAFKAFRAIAADKLTTEEIFKIYDIISAANMGGWEEGRKSMLSIYAPHVYKILYPEQETPLNLIPGFMGMEMAVK